MQYRLDQPKPSLKLAPYIRAYYLFESKNTGVTNIVPPWTKSAMILQYGGDIESSLTDHQALKPTILSGISTNRYTISGLDVSFKFFAVEFTPVGTYLLFKEHGSLLMNQYTDIFDVLPARKKSELAEALSEATDAKKKVEIVEHFLQTLLPTEKAIRSVRPVVDALQCIESSHGQMTINAIATELNYSTTYLRRLMKEVTGISPKHFSQIVRFRRVFNAVMDGKKYSYQHPEFEDYYDQAHFIRTFKSYTGYSPYSLPKEAFLFSRIFM